MKRLYLTAVVTVPSEEGQKRIDEEEKEFYKANPKSEITKDGEMFLQNHELEYEFLDYLVPLKNIIDVTDTQEIGSIIILKNGMSVHVEETVEHINFMIYMLTMSWWDRLKFRFSNFFAKK